MYKACNGLCITLYALVDNRKAVGKQLLCRPVLEALGLDTKNILSTTAESHYVKVIVPALLSVQFDCVSQGKIARVLEVVYHNDVCTDNANLDEDDGWIDGRPDEAWETSIALVEK